MIPKTIEMDDVFRDTAVADAFVQDKLMREGAHCLLKTFYAQVAEIVQGGLSACVPPENFELGENRLKRVWDPDKRRMFWEDADGNTSVIIPDNMLTVEGFAKKLKLFTNTLDRCPTNSCMLNFCVFDQGMCLTANWGRFHDIWNSVKNAGKKKIIDSTGAVVCIWTSVIRFSSIANINHGPFRSGCWGRGKQATVRKIEGSMNGRSAVVREAIIEQCRLLGIPVPTTDEGFEEFFQTQLLLAASAHSAGSILKFARWKSVVDNWEEHRPQIWYEKVILSEMGNGDTSEMIDDFAAKSTSMHDTEIAEKMTKSKTGLLARAPSYITRDLCLHLDIFCSVTRPLSNLHGYCAAEVRAHQKTSKTCFFCIGAVKLDT